MRVGLPLSKFNDSCRHKWTLKDYAPTEGLGVMVLKCKRCFVEHYYTKKDMTPLLIKKVKEMACLI